MPFAFKRHGFSIRTNDPKVMNAEPDYAALTFPVRYKTNGGVRVNKQAQIVDPSGKAIANVYAAGNCCGSVSPNLAQVAASGLYVGEQLAAALKV